MLEFTFLVLPRSDLNTFALVSKECHYVRNQPELDQTREASIVLKTDLFKVYPAGALHNSFESAGHGDLLLIVNFATKWIRDLNSKPQFTELRIHILRSDSSRSSPLLLSACFGTDPYLESDNSSWSYRKRHSRNYSFFLLSRSECASSSSGLSS